MWVKIHDFTWTLKFHTVENAEQVWQEICDLNVKQTLQICENKSKQHESLLIIKNKLWNVIQEMLPCQRQYDSCKKHALFCLYWVVQNCLLFRVYRHLYIAVCPRYFHSSSATGISIISRNKQEACWSPFIKVSSQRILFQIREEHR